MPKRPEQRGNNYKTSSSRKNKVKATLWIFAIVLTFLWGTILLWSHYYYYYAPHHHGLLATTHLLLVPNNNNNSNNNNKPVEEQEQQVVPTTTHNIKNETHHKLFLSSNTTTTTTTTTIKSNEQSKQQVPFLVVASPQPQPQDTAAVKDNNNNNNNNNNLNNNNLNIPWYYGWQPTRYPEAKCKGGWMTCLNPNHKCPKFCQDGDEESVLGTPPPEVVVPPDDSSWIPDVTILHRMFLEGKDRDGNPWPPPLAPTTTTTTTTTTKSKSLCDKFGKVDYNKELLETIPITPTTIMNNTVKSPSIKIFCGIYTISSSHAGKIRAMRETWAPRCDGFLAFSNVSDYRIPAINIPHDGLEEYHNMWQKSRAIWKFLGDNYLEDFDYFFLGGDDMFVIVDNLRTYLSSLSGSSEGDHFVGRRFKGVGPPFPKHEDNYYNAGGPGYALSRGTLRKYITKGYNNTKYCSPTRRTGMEDVMMAKCLQKTFGIGLTDTRDSLGRERFHPFTVTEHWLLKPGDEWSKWYQEYNQEWGLKYGKECCAPDSISFHYIKKPTIVRHLHALLYDCRSRNNSSSSSNNNNNSNQD